MKALRYLLIVMSLVSVLSIKAQGTSQLPEAQMQSTSVMMSSGSVLPQAATTGAVLTGETPGSYSPAKVLPGHIRTGWGEGGSDREEPYADPIGDAWPLALLAGLYLIIRVWRKRTRA